MSFFGVQLNSQNNRLMFEIRLTLSRNKFAPNFRTIYRSFSEHDQEVSGLIHPVHFQKALNVNGIFFKKYEFQVFEKSYKNQQGKINWFDFLSHLKEPMGPARRQLVQCIFDGMDQQKSGKVSVQKFLQCFNPSEIQSFKHGKKTREMVENQLLSMLAVQDGCITREQFITFYDDMNINFAHNEVFFRFVSIKWNHTQEKQRNATEEQVKAAIKALRFNILQKSQATKDEYLLRKLYDEFDQNNNGCLGSFEFDNLMKKFDCPVPPKVVEPTLQKIDRNKSGYIEYDDFKQFVQKDPYPI